MQLGNVRADSGLNQSNGCRKGSYREDQMKNMKHQSTQIPFQGKKQLYDDAYRAQTLVSNTGKFTPHQPAITISVILSNLILVTSVSSLVNN